MIELEVASTFELPAIKVGQVTRRAAPSSRQRAAASSGIDLIFDEMKPDDSRTCIRFEMTAHGVLHHGLQFVEGVGLSVDGEAQSSCLVPSFR